MKKLLFFIITITIILPTLLPLFKEGFFVIHDNTQVERVFQMKKSLSDGHFPVRWVEDLGYGYGYPIFNFYAPLPYYLGGGLSLVINDSLLATKIIFGIGIVTAFYTMYLLLMRMTKNSYVSILGGTVYLYFPYHALNIYVRGAVGEFFAYAFLPLVFLSILYIYDNINKKKKLSNILAASILLSLSLAAVVISHNLSAFMLGIFAFMYSIFMFLKVKLKLHFVYALLVFAFSGFILSSFYSLPAVFETSYTNVESQIGGGAAYADHFVCISQLWSSNWGFGGSAPGCIDGISFALGKINILLIAVLLTFFIKQLIGKKDIYHEGVFWIMLGISIFFMLPVSKFMWDIIPFMEYLQFPWRFMNFTALFLSIIVALGISKIKDSKVLLVVISVIIFSILYINAKFFTPVVYSDYDRSYYEGLSHIRWETSKISDEYMPSAFTKPISQDDLPVKIVDSNNLKAELIEENTGYIRINKDGPAGIIHINKAYFPSWEAIINKEAVDLVEVNDGMNIDVPEGSHEVVVRFSSTPIQSTGNILSLIGIVIVIIAIIAKRKKLYE